MYYKILVEFEVNGTKMIIVKCDNHATCVMTLEEFSTIIRIQSKRTLKAA